MKSLAAELQNWRDTYQMDYEAGSSVALPTEDNALRQLVYGIISHFLEDALTGDAATELISSLAEPDDRHTDKLVNAWVDATYGPTEERVVEA